MSAISNLQQALNCAGKCDCCNNLQSQVNDLKAEISRIPRVDENRIIQATKSALEPGIASAVVGGIAVVVDRLTPKIDDAIKKGGDAFIEAQKAIRDARLAEIEAKGASTTATKAEQAAGDYAAEMRKRVGSVEAEIPPIRATANRAETSAGKAIGEAASASTKAANAAKEALDANNAVGGLKGVVEGLEGRVGAIGEAIAKLESAVGKAITNAAKAIGISETALAATGRILGRIADIFNIIGTFAVLFEQIATLNVLGGRIDAIESGLVALGANVSQILGKLLGLQNRISANIASIGEVRGIALDAKGIGEGAARLAGTAQVTATRAEALAGTANGNAKQAQTTADGAVRNAKQANDNATTAYQKAVEATTTANNATAVANNATTKANAATTTANNATNRAGEAFQKALEALGVALTALALYQAFKGIRGLQGIQGISGIPGRNGINGINGMPGRDGITTVVQVPGVPGRQGDRGFPGFSGLPGRNGINGINGKDAINVNPAETASLRALIIQQHTQTRANSTGQHTGTRAIITGYITAALAPVIFICKQILDLINKAGAVAQTALLTIINNKLGNQVVGGIGGLITRVAENTYLEKALSVMTFAATMHNALMLSNNLGQTLIMIVDQVTGFLLPKGIDGTPINFSSSLGKTVHLVITSAIGEENYKQLSDGWLKANRTYQSTSNVYNQITNLGGILTAGMEVIGGNVGKIGNALKKGGVLLENAYAWMNPQPNLKGKFFPLINSSNEKLLAISAVVAIPIALKEVASGINSSVGEMKREISQTDPKDERGNPIIDKEGKVVHYKPGLEVPVPIVVEEKEVQTKADSTNFIGLVLEDIFDGSD